MLIAWQLHHRFWFWYRGWKNSLVQMGIPGRAQKGRKNMVRITLSPIIMEVKNGYIWKVTTIGGTHFWLPWLWEERLKILHFTHQDFMVPVTMVFIATCTKIGHLQNLCHLSWVFAENMLQCLYERVAAGSRHENSCENGHAGMAAVSGWATHCQLQVIFHNIGSEHLLTIPFLESIHMPSPHIQGWQDPSWRIKNWDAVTIRMK